MVNHCSLGLVTNKSTLRGALISLLSTLILVQVTDNGTVTADMCVKLGMLSYRTRFMSKYSNANPYASICISMQAWYGC